jgi:hypothetical protein
MSCHMKVWYIKVNTVFKWFVAINLVLCCSNCLDREEDWFCTFGGPCTLEHHRPTRDDLPQSQDTEGVDEMMPIRSLGLRGVRGVGKQQS